MGANGNGKNGNGHRLTPKQRAFVNEYLVDMNSAAAYRRAGYQGNNANVLGPRMLADVRIQDAIAKAQAERERASELNERWVLDQLRKKAENEETNDSAAVRAIELIGKHRGMFIDRQEHRFPDAKLIPMVLQPVDDDGEPAQSETDGGYRPAAE